MAHHAPAQFSGAGFLFFNNILVGPVERIEPSHSLNEYVNRHLGHVKSVAIGDQDHVIAMHTSDFRTEALRVIMNKLAKSRSSLTSAPAVLTSANFNFGQRITLLASNVAVTLTNSGALGVEVFKRNYSTCYTKTTDYTVTSSEITRVKSGGISSAQEVLAFYRWADASAQRFAIGRGDGPLMGSIRIAWYNPANGYLWQYSHTKAVPIGETRYAIERSAGWAGQDISFRLVHDADETGEYGILARTSAAFGAATAL